MGCRLLSNLSQCSSNFALYFSLSHLEQGLTTLGAHYYTEVLRLASCDGRLNHFQVSHYCSDFFFQFITSIEQLAGVLLYGTSSLLRTIAFIHEAISWKGLLSPELTFEITLCKFDSAVSFMMIVLGFCRMEVAFLLVIFLAYGFNNGGAVGYILLSISSWFMALSWLFAPYLFNPSGFEWQK